MEDYVLGVDAGNTKTIALVARADGTIAGYGRSGSGDIYNAVGTERALNAVAQAVTIALERAACTRKDLTVAVYSMAGADWPEDFGLLQSEMERRGFGQKIVIVNDAIGALRAGSPDGTGVAVVCGTAAATGARSPDGRVWHSSFWQFVHGAEELGRKTLRAVYQADLGIAPLTTLTEQILEHFGVSTVEEILHELTRRENRRVVEWGAITRVLMRHAQGRDEVASSIVREHAAALGEHALVAARRVGIQDTDFNLVLAGSLLRAYPDLLAAPLIDCVRAKAPHLRAIHARYEPVLGAVFLALEALGVEIEHVQTQIDASLPARDLFET